MHLKHLTQRQFYGAPHEPVIVPNPVSTFMPGLQKQHYAYFWAALAGGIGGLIALTLATVDTHSVGLEDVFIVAGSLLVPSLYVYYLDMRSMFVEPRRGTLITTFLLGAFLAAPIATVLESILGVRPGTLISSFLVGTIEEFAKGLAVLWLLRQKHRNLHFEMDGIIVGAAAGMGFAALEDILYGAGAFKHGLSAVVTVVWLRQVLGAFGHGTWTAIVVGTIWRVKGSGPPRVTGAVIGAYLIATSLHAAWDWMPVPGAGGLLWLLGVGIVGILILRSMIHEALRQEREAMGTEVPGQPAVAVEAPSREGSSGVEVSSPPGGAAPQRTASDPWQK